MLVIIEVLGNFSVRESSIGKSLSSISVISEIDPTPVTKVIIKINMFIMINLITSSIIFEVIGREYELVITVQSQHKSSISEKRGILLVFRFIDG
jgi:hypothetical protein